jgi:hypothetical protein
MNPNKRFGIGAVAGLVLLTLIGSRSAAAAPEADCDAQLTVELTPDVPDASPVGFLSSLVHNQPGYRLEVLQQIDPSLLELELSGPGPGYLCLNVIETMRKDARVLSIHIDSAGSESTLTASARASPPELWGVPVSSSGIGSLYWAAHHVGHAWKVLLPAVE